MPAPVPRKRSLEDDLERGKRWQRGRISRLHWQDLQGRRQNSASATKRVQPHGGPRRPRGRRTACTLTARPRAPTRQIGPSRAR